MVHLSLDIHEANVSIYPNFIEYLVAPHSNSCSFECELQSPFKLCSMVGIKYTLGSCSDDCILFQSHLFNCCMFFFFFLPILEFAISLSPWSSADSWAHSMGVSKPINWLWSQHNWGRTQMWQRLVFRHFFVSLSSFWDAYICIIQKQDGNLKICD